MKNEEMRAVMLVAVMMGVSVANAGGISADFDNHGYGSVNADVTAKINLDERNLPKVSNPQPVVMFAENEQDKSNEDQMILFKDILKGVLPGERVEFVSCLSFADRKVTSQGYPLLRNSGLSESSVASIVRTFEGEAGKNSGGVAAQTQVAGIGELLLGLPENIQEEFVDNLKFLGGSVVSAKTDSLEKTIAPEKYAKILDTIMPIASGIGGVKSVTRLKDHACWASTGAKGKGVLTGCSHDPGYTCNPSSCK